MADYQDMYLTMVRETEKAITLTEQALNILITAQRDCEEIYINSPEPVIQLLVKDAETEDEQEEEVSDKNYTGDEKRKIEDILRAFEGFIREQDYFDIVYSEKIGYVHLLTKDCGVDPVELLGTEQETIDTLFYEVVCGVVFAPGNQRMGRDACDLSEYEEAESRRRLTAIVETMEEDRDYWLAYIDKFLKDYQK